MKSTIRMAVLIAAGLILVLVARATPVQWNGNGHYYDFVPGNISWFNATGFSTTITFQGVPGYVATVTSAAENDFLGATFQQSGEPRFAWLGGMMFSGGVWRWKTGPESGTQFSIGATPTPPYNYANWGGFLPNGPFPFTAFNVGSSTGLVAHAQWANFDSTPTTAVPAIVGYLIEFDVPEPSTLVLVGLGALGVLCQRRWVMTRKDQA